MEAPVTVLLYLIPAMLAMGALALVAFMWALKSGQFDDLDGAAERILMDDDDRPAQPVAYPSPVAPPAAAASPPASTSG
ncbi:cbb3-type cytochrome oxidase assembly protein CcoS [Sphingosinicellaceae bacterium M-36]